MNCGKLTSLRLHIPERKELAVTFDCLNCNSEIKGKLIVDYENTRWDLELERGEMIFSDTSEADYYVEFSDTLPTSPPSSEQLSNILPSMRFVEDDNFFELKYIKDSRLFAQQSEWDTLKDLVKAYKTLNKNIISKLSYNLVKHVDPDINSKLEEDLDYHMTFSFTLNYFLHPWVYSSSYKEFAEWTSNFYFNEDRLSNTNIINFATEILSDSETKQISDDFCDLIIRFIDVRDFLLLANALDIETETYVSVTDFTTLKNFYTDCFEFVGRNGHIIFRLQNLFERGDQDLVPDGCPRNVNSANDFQRLDNGKKIDVINLSNEETLKDLFSNSFNHRLRNGINHFKSKFNTESQIISYYPITRRPNEEHTIKYFDFIKLCLNIFSTVMKFQQFLKISLIYKRVLVARNLTDE